MHVRPKIGMLYCVVSFMKTKVTKRVMRKSKNLFSHSAIGGNYKSVFQKPEAAFYGKVGHTTGS
jgi:hypothetical protein